MTRDNFPFGYRQITTYDHTGQPSYEYLPLQPNDFLNPGEDDHFNHGVRHDQDVADLYSIVQRIYSSNPFVAVLCGQKFVWPVARQYSPKPDIAIVADMLDPERPRAIFDVDRERTGPRCIIEVLSPSLADLDLGPKKDLYQQAGVAEYFIIDSGLRRRQQDIEYRVLGFQLVNDKYHPLVPDDQGRIYSASNEIWLSTTDAHDGFIVTDGRTGERIQPVVKETRVTIDEVQGTQRAQSIVSSLDFRRLD